MVVALVVIIAVVIPIALGAALITGGLPASDLPTTSVSLPITSISTSSTSSTSGTGLTATITIPQGAGGAQELNFAPATLSVAAGTTITFVDQDNTAIYHDVDFMTGPSGATLPSTSPNLKQGDTFTVMLTTPGTYTYVCDYHAWMKGTITVTG